MKGFVSEIILEVQGILENDRRKSIRSFKVSGTTVKKKLLVMKTTDLLK